MRFAILPLCAIPFLVFSTPGFSASVPTPERKPAFTPVSTQTLPQSAARAPAQKTRKEDFAVSRKGDLMLSCQALRNEVSAMGMIITEKQDVKDVSKMQSRGISAAGAVGSFLVGSVTGGIGLAVGGLMLDHNVNEKEEHADELQDIAEQRRTWIKGLYTAQACEGPIETTEQEELIHEVQLRRDPIEKMVSISPAAGDTMPGPEYQAELNTRYND